MFLLLFKAFTSSKLVSYTHTIYTLVQMENIVVPYMHTVLDIWLDRVHPNFCTHTILDIWSGYRAS